MMTTPYLLPLGSPSVPSTLAGGKGANLARLIRGGFPVPTGFVVTTGAYDAFVDANGLSTFLDAALQSVAGADDPAALNQASDAIRSRFGASPIPAGIAAAVRAAYAEQFAASARVAVRSSATAEDLPDLSFAGQQETFLNVAGPDAVLDAMRACWASLWTARAIGYRARNGIPREGLSLAVVVQAMVQAEAAGVLFTVNPLTGRRTESAIDATLGLGEALVSGQVEPDHYLVESASGRIVAKQLGAKIGPGAGADLRSTQALPDRAIAELVGLGQRVEAYFGGPQDIEWTWAAGGAGAGPVASDHVPVPAARGH